MTTTIDPKAMQPGTPVTVYGVITKLGRLSNGESEYGEWERRNIDLRQPDGTPLKLSVFNNTQLLGMAEGSNVRVSPNDQNRGCEVALQSAHMTYLPASR